MNLVEEEKRKELGVKQDKNGCKEGEGRNAREMVTALPAGVGNNTKDAILQGGCNMR